MIRSLLATCALALTLFAPGSAWADPAKDSSGTFQLTPPAAWSADGADTWKNSNGKEVLMVGQTDIAEDKLEAWAKATMNDEGSKWEAAKLTDSTLGGQKAKVLSGFDKTDGKRTFVVLYLSIKGSKGTLPSFVSEAGDSPEFQTRVQSVVQSFLWL